jgi:hypothetical protein
MFLMPVLLAQALSSCSLIDEPETSSDRSVKASLAFMVSGAERNTTRMANAVVQEGENTYRGINILSMTPFAINGETFAVNGRKIVSTDGSALQLGDVSPVPLTTPTFHLYNSYSMTIGVNAFLVYGRAPVGDRSKAENGSLLFRSQEGTTLQPLSDLTMPDLQTLRFTLDPIYPSSTIPAEATLLAGYLNHIVGNWSDPNDPNYLFFTGLQNEGNMVMAGSSANVMAHVNALYKKIYDSENSDLRTAILSRIKNLPATGLEGLTLTNNGLTDRDWRLTGIEINGNKHYPASEGLPDGAAALRWVISQNKFVPQTMTTPLDNINNIGRFCYPAELFYYVNSRIDTSNSTVGEDVYNNSTNWADVCSQYQYQPGTVTVNTRSVAIHDPLQYAVGRLKLSMIAATATLKDAVGEGVSLTNPTTSNSSFPLTGVIVCNQHPVDFNFKPVLVNGVASHADDRFIYDSQVKKSDNTYCYLTTTEESDIPSTLVLQTYDTGEGNDKKGSEEVTIVMEFLNQSGQAFAGKNCIIYPDTKFYLVGKVNPLEAMSSTETPESKGRVFTQDHVTTVNTKVQSLANAYNVLPDLIGGRLELGVELVSSWVQAETTNVILK